MVCYPQRTPMGCRLREPAPLLQIIEYIVSHIQYLLHSRRSDLRTDRRCIRIAEIDIIISYHNNPKNLCSIVFAPKVSFPSKRRLHTCLPSGRCAHLSHSPHSVFKLLTGFKTAALMAW